MRIGQVTQDNYKDYLKLLGIKNPKSLDIISGEGKSDETKSADWANKDYSHEAMEARAVAAGRAVAGMVVRPGDESWKKIVDVPDSYKQQAIKYARDLITMAAKTGGTTAEEHDKYVQENKDWSYMMSRPPEERLSISWTFDRLYQAEAQRITDYLKEKIPGWQPGQPFDIKVLTESNWGLGENHLDVKA